MVAIVPSPPAVAPGTYIPALDGLRAVAVLLVVAFHARLLSGGFIGVDVFFVLSAFLITRLLQSEISQTGKIRRSRFYLRRLMRLAPAFILMLGAYVLFAPLIWPGHPHLSDAMLAAFYVSNYSFAFFRDPIYLQHTWSLAVEEHFYLLWPLLLPLLLRARNPLAWLGAAYVAVICWRMSFAYDWGNYYYRTDTRATGLIVGAVLALYLQRLRFTPADAWTGMGAIILAAVVGEFGGMASTVFPVAEFGAVLVVGAAAQGRLGRLTMVLSAPVAIRIGKLSYGIYLWHYPITIALRPWLDDVTLFAAVLFPSIALAWLSFVTVERLPVMLGPRAIPSAPRA